MFQCLEVENQYAKITCLFAMRRNNTMFPCQDSTFYLTSHLRKAVPTQSPEQENMISPALSPPEKL